MIISGIHPTIFFFGAAFLILFLKEEARRVVQWIAPILAFLSLLTVSESDIPSLLGLGRIDRLSLLFGYVFTLSSFIGMIYALHVKQKGEIMAMFVYAGSALGVVFANDLGVLFLFWEMMAFSSVFLVLFSGSSTRIQGAGMRYLMVHIAGGICLFVGIILHAHAVDTTAFSHIPLTGLGPVLILLGVLVNAAAVPLHAWLPDAYPEATVAGAVFMSALTTKTAVYVLIRSFGGTEILIPIGTVMALYGAVYAVLENDIRRVLAYGIISQVGYMVAAVGMGGDLALNGASAHAFAHILYKGLLMMVAGTLIFMTGKRKLTELGGMYKTAPLVFALYCVGALSISGFPFFSGFVSKSMIISAAGESHYTAVALILTLVSCGTFLYTGLRLPYFIFFGSNGHSERTGHVVTGGAPDTVTSATPNGHGGMGGAVGTMTTHGSRGLGVPVNTVATTPANMLLAMGLAAVSCIVIGIFPGLLYQGLPFQVAYHPYTMEHVVSALELLLLTAVGFALLKRYLMPREALSLDLDWLYRKPLAALGTVIQKGLSRYETWMAQAYQSVLIQPAKKVAQWAWAIDTWVVDGLVNGTGWLTLLESRISEVFDVRVVDGAVNGISTTLGDTSKTLRRLQTGRVQNYFLAMVVGILVLAGFFIASP